jgi:hypothetical protein
MGLAQCSFGGRVVVHYVHGTNIRVENLLPSFLKLGLKHTRARSNLRNLVEDGFDFRFRLPKVVTEMAAPARRTFLFRELRGQSVDRASNGSAGK